MMSARATKHAVSSWQRCGEERKENSVRNKGKARDALYRVPQRGRRMNTSGTKSACRSPRGSPAGESTFQKTGDGESFRRSIRAAKQVTMEAKLALARERRGMRRPSSAKPSHRAASAGNVGLQKKRQQRRARPQSAGPLRPSQSAPSLKGRRAGGGQLPQFSPSATDLIEMGPTADAREREEAGMDDNGRVSSQLLEARRRVAELETQMNLVPSSSSTPALLEASRSTPADHDGAERGEGEEDGLLPGSPSRKIVGQQNFESAEFRKKLDDLHKRTEDAIKRQKAQRKQGMRRIDAIAAGIHADSGAIAGTRISASGLFQARECPGKEYQGV